jgi:FKBP-type peptidyl-prolyl cis-trans isomerase 2
VWEIGVLAPEELTPQHRNTLAHDLISAGADIGSSCTVVPARIVVDTPSCFCSAAYTRRDAHCGEDAKPQGPLRAWGFVFLAAPRRQRAQHESIGEEGASMGVQDGKRVSLEYTLRLDDETLIESNVGKHAFEYTQGKHEVVPGLESGLAGLEVGDSKRVTVPPEQGYGPIDPASFKEVDKDIVPADARNVGAQLKARGQQGRERSVRVHEVRENTVVIDGNHPLAGKTLVFDVKVLAVE